jgi:CheY-like chemotaxis protein
MCAVTAKASLEEGLRALRDNPEGFDLVMAVADTQGPGIDGFELLKHTKENYPVIRKSRVICSRTHGSS